VFDARRGGNGWRGRAAGTGARRLREGGFWDIEARLSRNCPFCVEPLL
jgi:hypothetical protein